MADALTVDGVNVEVKVINSKQPSIKPFFRPVESVESLPPCFKSVDRPLMPGASVCDCEATACSSTGPFIDMDTGEVVWVTAAHCSKFIETCSGDGDSVLNRPFSQPSPFDGGSCPSDVIGYSYKATPNFWDPNTQNATTDTIAIKLNPGITVTNYVCGSREALGKDVYLNGNYRVPRINDVICHAGRTTGVKCGVVTAINVTALVNYGCFSRVLENLIASSPILQPGDSGSVAFDPNTGDFLGEGFAGSDNVSLFINPYEIVKVLHLVPWAPPSPSPSPSPTPTPTPTPSPTPSPSPSPSLGWRRLIKWINKLVNKLIKWLLWLNETT